MRKLVPSLAACSLWLGCSTAPNPSTPHVATRTASTAHVAQSPPPEWIVNVASHWVEATDDGLFRGIAGTRFEARGRLLQNASDKPRGLDEARVAPPWVKASPAPCKYVFWHEGDIFGASEWLGEPRQIASFITPVLTSFDWFDGVGVVTANGMFVVHAATCTLDKLDLPGAAAAAATNAQRALVLTAFGHARWTDDTGKTFQDITAKLPNAGGMHRRRDVLQVTAGTDTMFLIDEQGAVKPSKISEFRLPNAPEPDPEDRWPAEHDRTSALESAVTNGLLLPNGEAIGIDGGLVARVKLATGRATEILRFGVPGEDCAPVAVKDRSLVVCEAGRQATVIDIGSGQVERSFDIEEEAVWDRFVVADGETLGFVGSCSGRNPAPVVDVVTSDSTTNNSTQRSATFCVRATSGTWVEHRIDPADATDILAWIPRADGEATALVALPGTFVHGTQTTEVRGPLRIVRIARNAPPIDIAGYSSERPKLVSRAYNALPDGSIEGWMSSGHSTASFMSIWIDAEGRPHQRPLPSRATTLVTAGRFALVRTEDSRYFETTDFGRTFEPIDPPPGRLADPMSATPIGVQAGPFLRIGWGKHAKPLPPPEPALAEPFSTQARRAPPTVRLGCRFSGPPVSGRISDSGALGLSKIPVPQAYPGRIPLLGTFYVPWRGLPNTLAGNAEFVYVPLLDLAAPVQRVSVPLSKLDGDAHMSHELRLGFVLDGMNVWPVTADRFSHCPASVVDEAGFTLPLGTCVEDPTIGVVVDDRAFLIHADNSPFVMTVHSSIDIFTADLMVDRSGKTKPRGTNVKALAKHYVSGGIARYKFAAGVRGKTPVMIAIDAAGNATLAPIETTHGSVGPEEQLVSLNKLQLGNNASCAPAPDDTRVLFPFTSEIGLATRGLPGIRETEHGGIAILRWSKQRVCLDAIDMTVHDERHEADMMLHVSQGPIRKVVARFDKPNLGKGTLAIITHGTEIRQPIVCEGAAP